MKKFVIYFLIGLLCLVLQAVWMNLFNLKTGPEFLFMLVVFSGVYHHPFGGLILSFIFGYTVDAQWGLMPGLFAMLFTILFGVSRTAGRRFYIRSFTFQILIITVMTLFIKTIEGLILTVFTDLAGFSGEFFKLTGWTLLWNALLAIPVFSLLEKIEHKFTDVHVSQFSERRGIL